MRCDACPKDVLALHIYAGRELCADCLDAAIAEVVAAKAAKKRERLARRRTKQRRPKSGVIDLGPKFGKVPWQEAPGMPVRPVQATPRLIDLPPERLDYMPLQMGPEAAGEARPAIIVDKPVEAVSLVTLGVEIVTSGTVGSITVYHTGKEWVAEFDSGRHCLSRKPIAHAGELCDWLAEWWEKMNQAD